MKLLLCQSGMHSEDQGTIPSAKSPWISHDQFNKFGELRFALTVWWHFKQSLGARFN